MLLSSVRACTRIANLQKEDAFCGDGLRVPEAISHRGPMHSFSESRRGFMATISFERKKGGSWVERAALLASARDALSPSTNVERQKMRKMFRSSAKEPQRQHSMTAFVALDKMRLVAKCTL